MDERLVWHFAFLRVWCYGFGSVSLVLRVMDCDWVSLAMGIFPFPLGVGFKSLHTYT